MGYASYYEDAIDARGESKTSKSTKPKVSNRRESPKKQYVPEDDICFESLLNNLPVPKPSRPTPKDNIDARSESKRPNTLRSKPSSKTRQRKTLRSKRPNTLRSEPSPKMLQRIRQRELRRRPDVPVTKTRYVPPDEIQRRIQREIIRLGK